MNLKRISWECNLITPGIRVNRCNDCIPSIRCFNGIIGDSMVMCRVHDFVTQIPMKNTVQTYTQPTWP